ncbi:MAG: pyruvate ferredoxin oxidoreductase [Thermoprotei archaeon]|nr:MAG: pyruvate ferredoxin oxidoreductase [Thermoprotei archaeon]
MEPRTVTKVLVGNHAVAEAIRLARVQVVAAYPITPQTVIVERIAEMVESGELKAKYIRVESEHSALAAVYGAAAAGARAFTATSSHGLLYMYEMLWWLAQSHLPLVLALVTRAIGPPWNIHTDHQDLLTVRDAPWIIAMAENVQEAFDLTLQGFKISEDKRVLLPFMVGLDGFVLSHTAEPVSMPTQETVDAWLPPREPEPWVLEPGKPFAVGNVGPDEVTMELRWLLWRAVERARTVIREVDREYEKIAGRSYGGLVERYRLSDAKYVVVTMGAWSGDAKEAVDRLRDEGVPVGLLRIRFVRPFPKEEVLEVAAGSRAILVVDRAVSMGNAGVLGIEISSVVRGRIPVKNVIAGLGGTDTGYEDFEDMIRRFVEEYESGRTDKWLEPEWYMPWFKR